MKAFLTGSRVYGSPRGNSDIDLVVFLTPRELEELRQVADSSDEDRIDKKDSDGGPQFMNGPAASLRFGKLNLICVTDPLAYAVWLNGTKILTREAEKSSGPVLRPVAIAFFEALRRSAGLFDHRPTVQEIREEQDRRGSKRGEGGKGQNRKSDKNIHNWEGDDDDLPS